MEANAGYQNQWNFEIKVFEFLVKRKIKEIQIQTVHSRLHLLIKHTQSTVKEEKAEVPSSNPRERLLLSPFAPVWKRTKEKAAEGKNLPLLSAPTFAILFLFR